MEVFYHYSPNHAIDLKSFEKELLSKEKTALTALSSIERELTHNTPAALQPSKYAEKDIHYYYLLQNELIFWSDNVTDLKDIPTNKPNKWQYYKSSNAHNVIYVKPFQQGYLVALVSLKLNYPFENDQLINKFASGFNLDKNIDVVADSANYKMAVRDEYGNYLFSLIAPQQAIHNPLYGYAGFLFEITIVLLLLFLIAQFPTFFISIKPVGFATYLLLLIVSALILGFSFYFNFPNLLYWSYLFSAFDYASNELLSSLVHLSIFTGFILAFVSLFYFHVSVNSHHKQIKQLGLQLFFGGFFLLFYHILNGIVWHSSLLINILSLSQISFGAAWLHFLMLLWGFSLALVFFKTHKVLAYNKVQMLVIDVFILLLLIAFNISFTTIDWLGMGSFYVVLCMGFYLYLCYHRKLSLFGFIVLWVFIYSFFIIETTSTLSQKKSLNKYKVLSQNILMNGSIENDRITNILFEDLDNQISNDKTIGKLIVNTDSVTLATDYLNENYLGGFWNKFDMRLTVTREHSVLFDQFENRISSAGIPVSKTHFYSFPASANDISYLGKFAAIDASGNAIVCFMSFFPRKNFKSYSFPKFLIATENDIHAKLNIAVAQYKDSKLVYASSTYPFPMNENFSIIPAEKVYTSQTDKNTFYVYKPDNKNAIIIVKLTKTNFSNYLIYFSYTFIVFILLTLSMVWLFLNIRRKPLFSFNLSTKYQLSFMALLLVSFIGIFYVSVNFITVRYKQKQMDEIDKKKTYIQNALQEKYYWTVDLGTVSPQGLNFDLQDLSYMYQTDINAYNNAGQLVGSSQPLIFNKNLTGKMMASEPFFGNKSTQNQTEYIGELKFLTGYADFYNGDYLQIGYISIPLYVSSDKIRQEIESFLSVIVHIYFVILLLSLVVSFIIGKQLSAPLKLIESKLRAMRFDKSNEKIEKIDYSQNDEIGQLVMQYNKTIDALEHSAKLLAKSERELAWRTMARQIAHEINNPLTPMKLTIQQLQRTKQLNDPRFDDYFAKSTITLVEQIDNLSRIAGTFSNFARLPEAHFVRFDIAAKLFSAVQLFANNNESISITFDGQREGVFVLADAEQMLQVFNNLLKNAMQAIPANANGVIKTSLMTHNKQVIIEIADNGIGIHESLYDKLFSPNFTTKTTGTGLGLAISKNIVELAGGKITFKSTKEGIQGSLFRILLTEDE